MYAVRVRRPALSAWEFRLPPAWDGTIYHPLTCLLKTGTIDGPKTISPPHHPVSPNWFSFADGYGWRVGTRPFLKLEPSALGMVKAGCTILSGTHRPKGIFGQV